MYPRNTNFKINPRGKEISNGIGHQLFQLGVHLCPNNTYGKELGTRLYEPPEMTVTKTNTTKY